MPKRKVQKIFNQALYDLVKEKYLNLIDRAGCYVLPELIKALAALDSGR